MAVWVCFVGGLVDGMADDMVGGFRRRRRSWSVDDDVVVFDRRGVVGV